MKKKIIIVVIALLAIVILMLGMYFYGLTSVTRNSEKVTFNIEKGTSTKEVINDLYEAKLIKSKISSLIYVKLHKNILIQAGSYELDRKYDVKELFDVLNKGKVIDDSISITFVEGKRVVDYVKQIASKFNYSEEEILNVFKDEDYLKELINKYNFLDESILNKDLYYSLEGYLFPDT